MWSLGRAGKNAQGAGTRHLPPIITASITTGLGKKHASESAWGRQKGPKPRGRGQMVMPTHMAESSSQAVEKYGFLEKEPVGLAPACRLSVPASGSCTAGSQEPVSLSQSCNVSDGRAYPRGEQGNWLVADQSQPSPVAGAMREYMDLCTQVTPKTRGFGCG